MSDKTASAVAKLLECLYLYPHYRVGSRGPSGLIRGAIEDLDPEVARKMADGEPPESFIPEEDL